MLTSIKSGVIIDIRSIIKNNTYLNSTSSLKKYKIKWIIYILIILYYIHTRSVCILVHFNVIRHFALYRRQYLVWSYSFFRERTEITELHSRICLISFVPSCLDQMQSSRNIPWTYMTVRVWFHPLFGDAEGKKIWILLM